MYQTERILRRFVYRCLLGIDFTEEIMKIWFLFFLQAVALAVFKKLLFALKPYFSARESVLRFCNRSC